MKRRNEKPWLERYQPLIAAFLLSPLALPIAHHVWTAILLLLHR